MLYHLRFSGSTMFLDDKCKVQCEVQIAKYGRSKLDQKNQIDSVMDGLFASTVERYKGQLCMRY